MTKKTFDNILTDIKDMQGYTTQFHDIMSTSYGAQKNAEIFLNKLQAFSQNLLQYVKDLEALESEMREQESILFAKESLNDVRAQITSRARAIHDSVEAIKRRVANLTSSMRGEIFNRPVIERGERNILYACDDIQDGIENLKSKAGIVEHNPNTILPAYEEEYEEDEDE